MTQSIILCVCCAVLRTADKPRTPTQPPVCDGCRERVRGELEALPDAYAQVPSNLEPGRSSGARAIGFESRPPLAVGALNLLGPGALYLSEQGWGETQIGELPPLVLLDQWAANWIDVRDMRETQPDPIMTTLVTWLLLRLDWAMDHHPAIDEFATTLVDIGRSVRTVNRTGERRGEPAGRCPMMQRDETPCGMKLFVDPYLDYITCGRCGTTWNRRKREWMKLRAAQMVIEEAAAARKAAEEAA